MWKNDNFFIGAFSALILSVITAFLIILTGPWVYRLFSDFMPQNKLLLLALIPAIILMRYYLRKLRFEKAGMGSVAIVFLLIILYFVFLDNKPFSVFFLNL
jgi:chromate transport protein ChrA